jgi:hypothetical protein
MAAIHSWRSVESGLLDPPPLGELIEQEGGVALRITSWAPVVALDEVVGVSMEAEIVGPDTPKGKGIDCISPVDLRDGRTVHIRHWNPRVTVDPGVRVEIAGLLAGKKEMAPPPASGKFEVRDPTTGEVLGLDD